MLFFAACKYLRCCDRCLCSSGKGEISSRIWSGYPRPRYLWLALRHNHNLYSVRWCSFRYLVLRLHRVIERKRVHVMDSKYNISILIICIINYNKKPNSNTWYWFVWCFCFLLKRYVWQHKPTQRIIWVKPVCF